MKKLSFIAAAAALLSMVACNKDMTTVAPEMSGKAIKLYVTVDGDPQTRATGVVSNSEDSEAKVNDLQVIVFNGNSYDGYGHVTASKSITVNCTAGTRDIYALVNGPDISGIKTKSQLLEQVATLNGEISNFIMMGSKSETLEFDGNVVIPVDRFAARVVIKGIRNSLESRADFKILSVYLTNVTGDVDFGISGQYTVQNWYNKRGYQAANNLGSFTFDAVNSTIAAGETYSTAHYFYSMPNGNAGAVGGAFTPRAARLVVKAEVNGTVYDYPILLPALERNHSYEIELLTITRAGNIDDGNEPTDNTPDDIDEEKPIVGIEQGFEITVNDWTTVIITDGTTI